MLLFAVFIDELANNLDCNDYNTFWKSVNNVCNKKGSATETVNGVCGPVNIANMWKDHYINLFNSSAIKNSVDKDNIFVSNYISKMSDDISNDNEHCCVKPEEVLNSIHSLKCGKAAGHDDICPEHIKFASNLISVLLSICFTSCITHGYLPQDMIKTILVPIIKNKSGDVNDKGNYRPIAISTAVSKILEDILLKRLKDYLVTTDNQFGFKKHSSTDMCVYSLKEIIEMYNSQSSPVFVLFLDASKAFDKVEHFTLFRKLINRGVPRCLIRLLLFWYKNQMLCVRWAGKVSSCFHVLNGVKQGGILSPYLFNVYMDDLSVDLSNMQTGCNLNNVCLNHIIYADDLTLLAPSVTALHKLIDKCLLYAANHNITFNSKKSVAMYIKPKGYEPNNIPTVWMNNTVVDYKSSNKYLGVIISNDMTCNADMKRQIRCIYTRSNQLLKHFWLCSNNVKIRLFKTYCINFYCCQLWCLYKRATISCLKVAYNNSFRKLLGLDRRCSASNMFTESNVNSFDSIRRKHIFGFRNRIDNSNNSVLKTLYNSRLFTSSLNKEWTSLLYLNKKL